MIRIGVAQWCLDCTGADAVYRAASLGFSAIQIDAGEPGGAPCLSDLAIQQAYLQAVQETGVEITAIALNILNSYSMNSLAGSNESRTCWDVIQLGIDAATTMGIRLVFLPSFDNGEIRSGRDLTRTAEILQEACIYAEDRGVFIATENTLGVAGNKKLLATVGHPNLCILIDTLNPVLWGHQVPELIQNLWPYMCDQIHAKDGINGMMGNAPLSTGQANFSETARTLRRLRFSGYIVLENEYFHDTEVLVASDMKVIARLFNSAKIEVLRHGRI